MLISDETGGITSEATAGFTFLLSEPTLHAFSPELVEDAVRNTYQADQSGIVYSLVIVGRALKKAELSPTLVPTIAGEMAAVWNENAAVPGVSDIVETQETTALGSLYDVFQVAVESTSGLSTTFLTLTQNQTRPDIFAGIIAAAVKRLDANEAAT